MEFAHKTAVKMKKTRRKSVPIADLNLPEGVSWSAGSSTWEDDGELTSFYATQCTAIVDRIFEREIADANATLVEELTKWTKVEEEKYAVLCAESFDVEMLTDVDALVVRIGENESPSVALHPLAPHISRPFSLPQLRDALPSPSAVVLIDSAHRWKRALLEDMLTALHALPVKVIVSAPSTSTLHARISSVLSARLRHAPVMAAAPTKRIAHACLQAVLDDPECWRMKLTRSCLNGLLLDFEHVHGCLASLRRSLKLAIVEHARWQPSCGLFAEKVSDLDVDPKEQKRLIDLANIRSATVLSSLKKDEQRKHKNRTVWTRALYKFIGDCDPQPPFMRSKLHLHVTLLGVLKRDFMRHLQVVVESKCPATLRERLIEFRDTVITGEFDDGAVITQLDALIDRAGTVKETPVEVVEKPRARNSTVKQSLAQVQAALKLSMQASTANPIAVLKREIIEYLSKSTNHVCGHKRSTDPAGVWVDAANEPSVMVSMDDALLAPQRAVDRLLGKQPENNATIPPICQVAQAIAQLAEQSGGRLGRVPIAQLMKKLSRRERATMMADLATLEHLGVVRPATGTNVPTVVHRLHHAWAPAPTVALG